MVYSTLSLISIILTFAIATQGKLSNSDNSLGLTPQQNDALEELKALVAPRIKHDFMKNDFYLLKFLINKKFDVDKAEAMFRSHLEWREDREMDKIHQEDWSDMEKDYPYRLQGSGKDDRPVIQVDFALWNLQKAYDEGKMNRAIRWYTKMVDEAALKVIKLQNQGKNITSWIQLGQMDGLTHQTHVNLNTSRFYFEATDVVERNYPGMMELILLDSPEAFDIIESEARYNMADLTKDRLISFRDETEWKPYLFKRVDPSELPKSFGGTKGLKKEPVVGNALLVGAYQRQPDGSWKLLEKYFNGK